MRYFVEDLHKYVGQKVELKGWTYNSRSSGKVKFLELRDGTGIVSCIFFKGECEDKALETFEQVTQECSVKVTGIVRQHPKIKTQFEIGAETLEIIGKSPEYPISHKEHGTDFLMEN